MLTKKTPLICSVMLFACGSFCFSAEVKNIQSGDMNGDMSINLGDVVFLLKYMFSDGKQPPPCGPCGEKVQSMPPPWNNARQTSLGMGDVNADWSINIVDAVYLLSYLFAGGPEPESCGFCWPYGPKQLPATGIRDCCSGKHLVQIPCDDPEWPGQDGYYHSGYPPEDRFVDNGDGTISDLCTNLMWQKETMVGDDFEDLDPVENPDKGPGMRFIDALEKANKLQLAGYDDWRMPNIFELYSLAQVKYEVLDIITLADSAIPDVFPRFPPIWSFYKDPFPMAYFSSTSPNLRIYFSCYAETYTFFDDNYLLRCVRGGLTPEDAVLPATGLKDCLYCDVDWSTFSFVQQIPCDSQMAVGQDAYYRAGCPFEGRFYDNEDGTITDLCTGLMWQKQVNLLSEEEGGNEFGGCTWKTALNYAWNLEFAGYDDWRLPNLNEIVYVIDWGFPGYGSEGVPPDQFGTKKYPFQFPPDISSIHYRFWTSTSTEREVFSVDFAGHHKIYINQWMNDEPEFYLVRCVRGPIWLDE